MTKLEQAKLFLDFYFSPWGAAKGEIWEAVTGDETFGDETVIRILGGLLAETCGFSEEDIKSMKIVVS